jgi:hypothetical protein
MLNAATIPAVVVFQLAFFIADLLKVKVATAWGRLHRSEKESQDGPGSGLNRD